MKLPTLLCLLFSPLCFSQAAGGRKNVLFLVTDDLRPSIGPYKGKDSPSMFDPEMITPNLDALARKSMVMKKAYAQYSVSITSRMGISDLGAVLLVFRSSFSRFPFK
jgi:iduronate 2-sulfatase